MSSKETKVRLAKSLKIGLAAVIDSLSGRMLTKFKFYNEKGRLAYGLSVMSPATKSSKKYMLEHSTERAIKNLQIM